MARLFLMEYPQLFSSLKPRHLEDYKKILETRKSKSKSKSKRESARREELYIPPPVKPLMGNSKLQFHDVEFSWESVSPQPPDSYKRDFETVVKKMYRTALNSVLKFLPDGLPNPFVDGKIPIRVTNNEVLVLAGNPRELFLSFSEQYQNRNVSFLNESHDAVTFTGFVKNGKTDEITLERIIIVLDLSRFVEIARTDGRQLAPRLLAAFVHEVGGHIPDALSGVLKIEETSAYERSVHILEKMKKKMEEEKSKSRLIQEFQRTLDHERMLLEASRK